MAIGPPEIRIVHVFQSYEFFLSTSITDFGRPMKPFSLKSRIFGLGQTNWANKLWGIWGIFGNQHPFWYSEFLVHVFHYSIIISTKNTKPLYPHPKYGIGI